MKSYFLLFGLAGPAILAPMTGYAQDLSAGISSSDGNSVAPDSFPLSSSANPFTGAAGADRYTQDNTLAGFPAPATPSSSGNVSSLNNFIGGASPDDSGNNGNSGN
jgi:hypothetical protein